MDNIEAKERFSFNLLSRESRAFNTTVMYVVYKTIELNRGISLNKLKWVLNSQMLIPADAVEGAVASLVAKNLFNCVSRWQPTGSSADHVHLRTRRNCEEFSKWLDKAQAEYPELKIFIAPDYSAIANKSPSKH